MSSRKVLLNVLCLAGVVGLTGCDNPIFQKWLGKDKDATAMFQRVEGGDKSAIEALEESALKRNEHSMLKLGYIYHTGTGGQPRDPQAAAGWYVQCKLPQCRFNLALLQLSGEGGVQRDVSAAINALREAANQDKSGGNLQAMIKLGKVYSDGVLVPKNAPAAATWFEKGGTTYNDPYALYRIGRIYTEGDGRPVDAGKAMRYLKKSADMWNGDAMYYLAKIHAEGAFGEPSLMEAAKWMMLASERGEPWKSAVAGLLTEIPEKEMKMAERQVDLWKKAHKKYPDNVDYEAPLAE